MAVLESVLSETAKTFKRLLDCFLDTGLYKSYHEEKSYRTASLQSHRQSNHSPTAREHPLPIRHSIRTFPTTILPVACNHLPNHNQNTATQHS